MSDDTMSQEKETVGQRVERAMLARGLGYNEVDRALGYSEGYTSRLVHSPRQPRANTLATLSEVLRVDLAWLASGKGSMGEESPAPPANSGPRAKVAKDLPGWAEALGLAVMRWRRIPTSAWAAVSMLSFDNPPERITPDFIFEAAQGWLKQASDDELAAAEEADTRRVMAEEDAAYIARTTPIAPAVIPTNPGPTKAVPRKKSVKLGGAPMLLTPLRVVYIYSGEYDKAGVDPPVLPVHQYKVEAAAIHDRAKRPTDWPDPRGVALGWELRVVPACLGRKASTDGKTIYYKPSLSLDPRLRGLLIWHEICHCYLRRFEPDATEADAWILTGACVLSWENACRLPMEVIEERQQHAPLWFLELQKDFVLWHTLFSRMAAE